MPLRTARRVAYNPEAKVWWTESSTLFGVNAEAETLGEIRAKLPDIVRDMIDANEPDLVGRDVEIVVSTHARPRLCSMKSYGKLVRAKLLEMAVGSCAMGDHDVWFSPVSRRSISKPGQSN